VTTKKEFKSRMKKKFITNPKLSKRTHKNRKIKNLNRVSSDKLHGWGEKFLNWVGLFVRVGTAFSLLIAVIFYFIESDSRIKQKHYQAWQVINSAQNKRGSGGRIQALEELNKDHISLAGVNLSYAYLRGINLQNADLMNANFQGANLCDANFKGSNLWNANLQGTNLWNVEFQRANLKGANLEGAELWNADLQEANLGGANLKGAMLWYANLRNAKMCNTGFILMGPARVVKPNPYSKIKYDPNKKPDGLISNSYYDKANFMYSDLMKHESANLQYADLTHANLRGADLRATNLDGANLWGVVFTSTKLQGVKGLTIDQLLQVTTLYKASLDPPLKEQIKKDFPLLFNYADECTVSARYIW